MLRDAYVRAIVSEHFSTFDRIRHQRDTLGQVTILLSQPMRSWRDAAADVAEVMMVTLNVRIPLVVHSPAGGLVKGVDAHPLISRTAFFRIMEGQVLDALNVQRAWPDDLEDWDGEDLERSVGLRIHEERARNPVHIRDILAPIVQAVKTPWAEWLGKTASTLASRDQARKRFSRRDLGEED